MSGIISYDICVVIPQSNECTWNGGRGSIFGMSCCLHHDIQHVAGADKPLVNSLIL